jgi:hypothetical protein
MINAPYAGVVPARKSSNAEITPSVEELLAASWGEDDQSLSLVFRIGVDLKIIRANAPGSDLAGGSLGHYVSVGLSIIDEERRSNMLNALWESSQIPFGTA